jgi:succinate dehydrogenase / fumarate reductase cytochrome b subunit
MAVNQGLIKGYVGSSIGKKQIVAITSLFLNLFLLTHMTGNILILVGAEAYNKYAYTLTSTPLIYVAEAGLLALFLTHVILAITVNKTNRDARQTSYAMIRKRENGSTRASRTMILTGMIIFVFVVLHLMNFKFGAYYPITYDGVQMRDLYRLVIEDFKNPVIAGGYILALGILFTHLKHGVWSSFQTLGLNSTRTNRILRNGCLFFAALVCLGFSIAPVYAFFFASVP